MQHFYEYTWQDGTITFAYSYDRDEMAAMVRKHGKMMRKKQM